MKKAFCVLFLVSTILIAQTAWVRVYYHNDYERQILINKGYDILSGNAQEGYFDYFLDTETVKELEKQGFGIEILHPDVIKYLEETYGNLRVDFGYYYTFAEMVQELDQIAASYPSITHKVSIGQSWEGREIWAMKVSDNAGQNENEPTVLFTGIHHAREPICVSICMDFINWLTQNYGTNDTATTIVNTDEVWFVPCMNPDGYVYNETDPWGNWRKNRRDNGGGTFGVDPNRNYAYQWGYDDQGSSPNPSAETYRGPAPFSEPENQAVRELCDTFEFEYALNYHSYANVLIVPWGYINDWVPSPDSGIYHIMAESMTTYIGLPNNWPWGTAYQTIGYNANGVSDDWMYGEQTEKPKCFSFTAEVGTSFWQAVSDTDTIIHQCNQSRPMNIFLCMRAAVIGIEENKDARVDVSSLSIFPNPAQNRFSIIFDSEEPTNLSLNVYDATGRQVMERSDIRVRPKQRALTVNVSRLPAGIYFVEVINNKKIIASKKIIVLN
jgi:hypothetical protein